MTGDALLRGWDATTGRPVGSPVEISDGATTAAVTVAPTGSVLALATKRHIEFRDTATHRPVGVPVPVGAAPATLAFSRTGSELLTGTYDAVVRRVPTAPLTDPYEALCAEVGPPDTRVRDAFAPGETRPATC
ncbi:hypothetical protein [Streptomyces flavalbus]|uniref:Uncharacterized protein n=1 Tax=Streptomyces flavalbus TaxID=2665155 RepID=A0ABW2W057_9ACTN